MKAVRFSQFGGPEVLEIVDLPDPHRGPGQVRIAVRAAGVNPSDWKKRRFDRHRPSGYGSAPAAVPVHCTSSRVASSRRPPPP